MGHLVRSALESAPAILAAKRTRFCHRGGEGKPACERPRPAGLLESGLPEHLPE